jgi:2'-5' RNA ligase
MVAIESALVILVPEAEDTVRPFRDLYDPSAADSCPAHVTLLYPFKAPADISEADLRRLDGLFAAFAPFRFCLSDLGRFPGVLYLAPVPSEPFRALTSAIEKEFPETPLYGGAYPDIVPHLSVANLPGDEPRLDRIAADFSRGFAESSPISATASEVVLLDTRDGRWKVRATFRLRGAR